MDIENVVPTIGGEIMNYTGLTVGQTYWVGVRNFNSTQGTGIFTICIQKIGTSGCDYGIGPYTFCNVYKLTWKGVGVSYKFNFSQTTSPFSSFTKTQASVILVLSNVPSLQYGYTYNTSITALYTHTTGSGTEILQVPQTTPCTMILSPHPVTELRSSDRCSSGAKYRGATVASLPWVCGATDWKWKFVELNNSDVEVGIPIIVYRGAANNFIGLGFIAQLQNRKNYNVYTAPVFSYVDGTFGPSHKMCILASTMPLAPDQDEFILTERSFGNEITASIYPNPNSGDQIYVHLKGIKEDYVTLRLTDALGRIIWTQNFSTSGDLKTTIVFDRPLAQGFYSLFWTVNRILAQKKYS